ncbi:MAG TPA: CBS domain-containing protein [Nitrososphaerales archaeon]|nr:CBS domain-containing protein [Nitrososphaerales archaeon]
MSISVVNPQQLRKIRTQLGITQAELARASDVSQSLIAKVESGRVDPSFTTMKAISDALQKQIRSQGRKVKDVMSRPVLSVQASTPISECVNLMRNRSLSQLPVYSGQKMVGSISDKRIVSLLSDSGDPRTVLNGPVSRFMEGSFPTVDAETPLDALYSLFSFVPAVLVTSGDRIEGIITKIDVISVGTSE